MKKLFQLTKKFITSEAILAVCFVAFIVYMSIASAADVLTIGGNAIDAAIDKSVAFNLEEQIQIMNDQFENMIDTKQNQPLLHNKGSYIDLNGFMANLMGQKEMNQRVKLRNGYLYPPDNGAYGTKLKNFAYSLYQECESSGRDLLIGIVPRKIYGNENMLPAGFTDTTSVATDTIVTELEQLGIPIMHFGKILQEHGFTMEDAFYKTDHHWRAETGWWAYTEIIKVLNEQGYIHSVDEKYIDEGNFTFEMHNDFFLGSDGKRTGRYYTGIDDFVLIYPNFDVELCYTYEPDKKRKTELVRSGIFRSTAFNPTLIETENHYNLNPYGSYGWGDKGLAHWRNASAPIDKKVLMIGDSNANVPFAFLPLIFTTCDEMDFRHYTGDFRSHLEDFDPDIIIILGAVTSEIALVCEGF